MATWTKKNSGRPKGIAKTGGRQKGTPNKRTVEAIEIMNKLDFNPLEKMVFMYQKAMDEFEVDRSDFRFRYLDIASNQLKEFAQYVYPKRKSIEGPNGENIGQSLVDILKQLKK